MNDDLSIAKVTLEDERLTAFQDLSVLGDWNSKRNYELQIGWIEHRVAILAWKAIKEQQATPPNRPKAKIAISTWGAWASNHYRGGVDALAIYDVCDALYYRDFGLDVSAQRISAIIEVTQTLLDETSDINLALQLPKTANPRAWLNIQLSSGRARVLDVLGKKPRGRGRPGILEKLDATTEHEAARVIEKMDNEGLSLEDALKPFVQGLDRTTRKAKQRRLKNIVTQMRIRDQLQLA